MSVPSRKIDPIKRCTICNSELYRRPTEQRHNWTIRKTCGKECARWVKRGLPARTEFDRFWEKVNFDGPFVRIPLSECWEWTSAIHEKGYGVFRRLDGSTTRAHRMAWILEFGNIPNGLHVLHQCDNRRCVRHLFLGTPADNTDDMISKGREKFRHKSKST